MMNKSKNLLLRLAATTLLATAALVAPAQSGRSDGPSISDTGKLTVEQKTELVATIKDRLQRQAFVPGGDFKKLDNYLDEQKEALDKADTPRDFSMAVNMALMKLGYSHVVLITPQAATARRTKQGVGIGIQLQPEEKGMRIVTVFAEAPAGKAGLLVGDLVLEANGKQVSSPAELTGDEGSVLELKVQKADGTIKDYKITRSKYSNVRPETLTWTNSDTAVIKIHTFDTGYNRKNVETLMDEARRKGKNLVIDLRSNPGGAVINMMHFLDEVLPPKTGVGTFITRKAVDRYIKETGGKPTDYKQISKFSEIQLETSDDNKPFKGNIAVLVNGGTGSAAEIVALTLKEALNTPVIGSKSAGAVLVSIMSPVGHGFLLQFPMMDYVSPMGVRLEGNGVAPVAEAPSATKFGEPDLAVEKAITLLQKSEKIAS